MKNRIIYKYLDQNNALKVIEELTLKFSQPINFNDPFDCYEELLEFKVTSQFVKDQLMRGILTLDPYSKSLSPNELINHLSKTVYTFNNPEVREIFSASKKKLWISCFSEVYNEILMWSHYGDQHKGICIGFNYFGLLETFDFIPSNVKYVTDFKKIDYCSEPVKALEYLINVKSERWKYEKEIRLRTNKKKAPSLNENGIISIHPPAISKIIIGCNNSTSIESIEHKLNKLNYDNVEIIKLKKSMSSFELIEE